MSDSSPRFTAAALNSYGVLLAIVIIAFVVRIYSTIPRPAMKPAPTHSSSVDDGRAAEQPKDDSRLAPFVAANNQFRAFYRHKREALLAQQPLIIAISGDDVTFTTSRGDEVVRFTPPEFHVLKTFAHSVLTLNLALAGDAKRLQDADLRSLQAYVAALADLLPHLSQFKLTEEQKTRIKQITELAQACVKELSNGNDAKDIMRKHTPALRELAMQIAYDAAKLQIDALKEALANYSKTHPDLDLKRAHIVVSGVQAARAGNLQTQTIEKTLGIKVNTESFVYAESLFDHGPAMALMGTRLLDTDASRRIFGDGERLWRDVFADAATKILAEEAKR